MISKKLIAFLIPLTFAANHSALGQLVDPEDVISVGTNKVTLRTKRSNTNAQRVVVMFNVYEGDVDGDTATPDEMFHCPVRVRTVDNVCKDLTSDPSVTCREPGNSSRTTMQKIKWRARGPSYDNGAGEIKPTFTVTFDNNFEPCKPDVGSGGSAYWSGGKVPRDKQVCKLKEAADFGVSPGKSAYVKFNIVGIAPASVCDPLDPFFIVRN